MFRSKHFLLFTLALLVSLLHSSDLLATEVIAKSEKSATITFDDSDKEAAWKMFNAPTDNTPTILTGTGCSTFDSQPSNQEVCFDGTAQFSVQIGDDFPTNVNYEWSMSTDNNNFQSLIGESGFAGATTSQLTVNDVTGLDGNFFRVQVTGAGCEGDGISDAAQLDVTTIVIENEVINTTCPDSGDGRIEASASGGASPYSFTLTNNSTNEQFTTSPPYSGLAPGNYTLEVVDDNSCVGLVSLEVEATPDVTPPTFTCSNTSTIALDNNGTITINATDLVSNVSDACGTVTVEFEDGTSSKTYDCSTLGTKSLRVILTDRYNNSDECNYSIDITDETAPTVNCSATDIDLMLSNGDNTVSISATDFIDGSDDNCEVVSILFSDGATEKTFGCDDVGSPISLTVIVADASGNETPCTRTVTVSDKNGPEISCDNDLVQVYLSDSPNGTTTLNVNNLATASDACGGSVSITFADGSTQKTYSCANVGEFSTLPIIATDQAGNTSNCSRNILIIDNQPPVVNCSDDPISIEFIDGNSITLIASELVDPTDNCAIRDVKFSDGRTTKTLSCDNTNDGDQVEIVVRDRSGNTASCMRTIDVIDNIAPTLNCDNEFTYSVPLDQNGELTILPQDLIDVTDNCAITKIEFSDGDTEKHYSCNTPESLFRPLILTVIVRDNGDEIGRCTQSVIIYGSCN